MKAQIDRSIQSLDRAFDILNAIAASSTKELSLKEICAATSLHPSTAHHLISTMVARGYVSQKPESRRYSLGPALLRLRSAALDALDLQSVAQPFAAELLTRTSESVYFSTLQGWDFPPLIMLPSPHPIRFVRQPSPIPCLHATASGKCLLAYQPDETIERYIGEVPLTRFTPNTIVDPAALRAELGAIRERGLSFDLEEQSVGAQCAAAPVFNDQGKIVAALSFSSPTFRATPEAFEQWTADVREIAAALSARLGFTPARSDP